MKGCGEGRIRTHPGTWLHVLEVMVLHSEVGEDRETTGRSQETLLAVLSVPCQADIQWLCWEESWV